MSRPRVGLPGVHPKPTAHRVDRVRLCGFVAVHALALVAPLAFSLWGLAVAVTLVLLTGLFGIGLGYHRLLAHRSFTAPSVVRYLLAGLGSLALQGGPLTWCAMHRKHHRHSDREIDPQQAGCGFARAHFLWALAPIPESEGRYCKSVRDLSQEVTLRWLEKFVYPINGLLALGLLGVGWAFGGPALGLSLLTWGIGVRAVYLWHATFLVNSVCHRWGYRNYETPDESRNCWWVALLTFGEGWHNNHHAYPRQVRHGHRWFEFDPTYIVLRVLQALGLATRVVEARRGLTNKHRAEPNAAADGPSESTRAGPGQWARR